ncbi:MAG: DUF4190 domain-containing protein [Chloroflexi bacterium]|nr:DUF4190 domain-containing protein [Chloroflexota bacterium]
MAMKTKKRRGFAIASLIFGIIGGYPLASSASIVAVILGHVALSKLKNNPDIYSGKGLAIAGLILGYVGLALAVMLGVMRGILKAKLAELGL